MAPRTDFLASLPLYALYSVNLYQPCAEGEILDTVAAGKTFSRVPRDRLSEALRGVISTLIEEGYVRLTSANHYFVTPRGIKLLSERKLAYPRDQHRLYYLKEVVKRRGK
jgi:hypothetical protein